MLRDPKNLAGNVRRHRVAAGMTQARLAELAGAADATISRIERGRLTPSVELAEKIASALDLTVDDLFGPRGKEPKRAPVRVAVARLMALVRDLDDAQVDDVTRAVKLLLAVGSRSGDPARRPTPRAR